MPAADPRHTLSATALAAPEIERLFAPLVALKRIGIAVSGGGDSTALMALLAEWAGRLPQPPYLHVVTVDHGLQAGSADACNEVLAAAARLGVTAETAVWLGPKPDTGIQAAARRARYHLLAKVANRQRLEVVATAHTEDDQAETLLMRLARGSGVDGLSGIAERIELAGVTFVRPLLGVTHGQLVATLVARGIGWRSDPANAEPRFERVRMREALTGGLADAAGLASRPLAASARRLARARRALEAAVDEAAAPEAGVVRLSNYGFAEVDWTALLTVPEEIRIRVLVRVIAAIGGGGEAPSLQRLEALTEDRGWRLPRAATLGRTVLRGAGPSRRDGVEGGRLLVLRETGRGTLPRDLMLRAGPDAARGEGWSDQIWDGRFRLSFRSRHGDQNDGFGPDLTIAALGAAGLAQFEASGGSRPLAPARALWALPAIWDGLQLVAVPALGTSQHGAAVLAGGSDAWRGSCRCDVKPLRAALLSRSEGVA